MRMWVVVRLLTDTHHIPLNFTQWARGCRKSITSLETWKKRMHLRIIDVPEWVFFPPVVFYFQLMWFPVFVFCSCFILFLLINGLQLRLNNPGGQKRGHQHTNDWCCRATKIKNILIKSMNSPVDSDLHHCVWYVLVLTAREKIKDIFNTSFSQKQLKTQNHAEVGRCNKKPRGKTIRLYWNF